MSEDKERYVAPAHSPADFTFPLLKFDVFSLLQLCLSSVHLQKGYFLECDGGVIFCGALNITTLKSSYYVNERALRVWALHDTLENWDVLLQKSHSERFSFFNFFFFIPLLPSSQLSESLCERSFPWKHYQEIFWQV